MTSIGRMKEHKGNDGQTRQLFINPYREGKKVLQTMQEKYQKTGKEDSKERITRKLGKQEKKR